VKAAAYYSTNDLPFPSKADFTKVFVYNNGQVLFEGNYADHARKTFPKGSVIQKVVDDAAYTKAHNRYMDRQNQLYKEFKRDLLEYHGVTDHPKANKAFEMAWEKAHGSGYQAVMDAFDDLVELLK
jgi:ribonuclease HIII